MCCLLYLGIIYYLQVFYFFLKSETPARDEHDNRRYFGMILKARVVLEDFEKKNLILIESVNVLK